MYLNKAAATFAATALLIASAGTALALGGGVDQEHQCPDGGCNDPLPFAGIYVDGVTASAAEAMLAQTFTAGVTGELTGVDIQLSVLDGGGTPPVSLQVSVVGLTDGRPDTAKALFAETLDVATELPNPGNTALVTIPAPAGTRVTTGNRYAIVIGPSEAHIQTTLWMTWEMESSASGAYTDYPGGEAMGASRNTGNRWVWANIAESGTADFAFITYVVADEPTPTPGGTQNHVVPTIPPTETGAVAQQAASAPGLPMVLVLLAGVAGGIAFTGAARTSRR